ncbi:DUF6445 family protein [Sphingomonas aracearum]|uniref:Uncharacterized protein n=1 Tax=Sphingomonas aracearum TaxID=2283317 RepID=A0A369VX60_9SPHN|nr:DUF6445 family protein [Sphingomonas aracearum]RDE05662.1 hypothetical protein DVW87_10630 [Sphingomonas aracearum]
MSPSVQVERIGREGTPVVIIDDFAPEPKALVEEAAGTPLGRLGAFYPGVRAPVRPAYRDAVGPLLAAAAKRVFGFSQRLAIDRTLFSLTVTPPAELTLAQRIPHIDDVAPGKLAVVHYLGRTDWGGTRFFRHRSTGFETVTAARHRPYLDALAADFRTHGEPPAGYITGATPLFEPIGEVAAVFNRAVLYPSGLLHCAAIDNALVLPLDVEAGRLTIASFLTAS